MFKPTRKLFAAIGVCAVAVLILAFYFSQPQPEKKPLARDALPNVTFSNIPSLPSDFFEKRSLLRNRKLNITQFEREYWIQPEFYPNFEEYAISEMLNPPENRWGAMGYGAYPSGFTAATKAGETVKAIVFFHTSWLVESYQGISLDYAITNLTMVPPGFEKGFAIEITPSEFLLGPAYPVFGRNWAEKVEITTTVGSVPAGEYEINFNIAKPSKSAEWKEAYPHYFDATGFGLSKPFFRMRLSVKG